MDTSCQRAYDHRVLRQWPLVGRTDELELIEQALNGPDSAGVVLAGAAGVGKTRLAKVVLERAATTGRSTDWVQATDSARLIPFGAFAHLLPGEFGGAGQANLLRVAADAIADRATGGQLVVGVDDAHLLDDSSAALVRHLAVSGSCFVVITVRSREPIPDAIVSLWKDGPLDRIELQSLSEGEVVDLIRSALGGHVDASTLHRLWEATGGNPLYLRELLTGGLDTGMLAPVHGVWRWRGRALATAHLTELVESRIGDLSARERHVLEITAQAEPLEAAFVDALSDDVTRESVERRGLLDTFSSHRRTTVRLSHPLYADAIRAATPPSVARTIWHRLAEQLADTGARRAGDLLRLATWRLGAGDRSDADLFTTAARQALTLQDFALAEQLASTAMDIDDGFEAGFVRASALVGMSRYADAEHAFSDLQRRAETDEQRGHVALRRSDNLFGPLGRGREALDVLARALGQVTAMRWRDALTAAQTRHELFGGNAAKALAQSEQIERRAAGDPHVISELIAVVTWGRIVAGRCREAREIMNGLHNTVPPRPGHYASTAPDVMTLGWCAAEMVLGDVTTAERIGNLAYQQSKTTGLHAQRGVVGFAYGWVLRVKGSLRAAVEVLTDSAAALREIDFYRIYSSCCAELAHCYALLGNVNEAEAALGEAEAARVPSFVMDYPYVMPARAWVAHARGERSQAREVAREWAAGCASYEQTVFAAFAWHDLARLGEPDAAVDALRLVASRVDGDLIPTFATHAAALATGDAAGLERVVSAFEQMNAALYAAEAAAEMARLFRHEGRTGSALTAAVRAGRLAERCEGARTPALEGLDASLPLTAREHEIAGLAARGLSNREIADRLVVSVRTVDNHLHNAYTKLGITQRADLAAIVLRNSAEGDGI